MTLKQSLSRPVVDECGNYYPSLTAAYQALGRPVPGNAWGTLTRRGEVTTKDGHTFRAAQVPEEPGAQAPAQVPIPMDPLLARLRSRYTPAELEQIAKGEGIGKDYIPFPRITLTGTHHRLAVISDTHIGSVYSPESWHDVVSAYINNPENSIEAVLHCGDLVEGLKIGRAGTQIYELSALGYDAQLAQAVEMMSKYERPIYIISGNHDMYFKEFAGANIVQAVAERVPNMTYIGHDTATIEVDGATIQLFHGGDGNSYALSYRLQKLVEAITGGRKPNIILAGHTHKYVHIFERNIQAVSVPSMQAQTAFMRSKKLAAHTGFIVIDFDVLEGEVRNFAVRLFPFYA